jgi:hypothetical protein
LDELGALQASVHALSVQRKAALSIFVASRRAATAVAQREFWLEFAWADQEYRAAVHRLAQFCARHQERGSCRIAAWARAAP